MKYSLLFFIVVIFMENINAQEIKVDAILGFNVSQIDGDDMAGFNKPGFLLGGGAGFDLAEDFGLQFRILFSQKGSRFTENDPIDLNYRLNYLDFPLMFEYNLDKELFEYAEHINLEAGFQFLYLLSAREGQNNIGFINLYDDFEPRIYGFLLGASYEMDKYKFRINFQRSLVSLHKSLTYFDRTLSFSIAYQL